MGRASGTALADAVMYTVMMNMAPIFLRNSLQLGTYPNSAGFQAALLQWCYYSRNFGANPTVSAGNVASVDDDRMQVDPLRKGKGKGEGKPHDQHDQHELYRHQHVQELWQNWTVGEGLLETGGSYDNSTSNNSNPQTGSGHKMERERQARGRCGNESAF